ncbi:MAG: hypothetical protein D6744_04465 [Planctomycetota bacterium]|nr:MAG: hypothetical protein D6744_04465 [Planctomycetota bacterium]
MLVVALLGLAAGCAPPSGKIQALVAMGPRRPANLLVGPRADDTRASQRLAGRSDWPAMDFGYRLDDVLATTDVTVNDESFFDRLGGGYYRTTYSTHTRTIVR